MVATLELLSLAHANIAGFLFLIDIACFLTGRAHLLSEFPSLRTGLTALPKILA
jgi:hypothetical protein